MKAKHKNILQINENKNKAITVTVCIRRQPS